MPVDKSKPARHKQPHRDNAAGGSSSDLGPGADVGAAGSSGHARELEVKRIRGEVSCAECRRLKIKCDKQIPCTSCIRRGCAALCPNGALATGQGTRFVLAATEHLHRKIAKMGERIRVLEDALAGLHARMGSTEGGGGGVHPLLVDAGEFGVVGAEARKEVGGGMDGVVGEAGAGEEGWEQQGSADGIRANVVLSGGGMKGDVIDAFGTLSISDHGISRFFGPTGGCESLLLANLPSSPSASASTSSPSSLSLSRSSQSLSPPSSHASAPISPPTGSAAPTSNPYYARPAPPPTSMLFSSSAFPLTPLDPPHAIHALVTSHLPPRSRARALVQSYFAQLAWLFRGVTRAQAGEMLRGVYGAFGRGGDRDVRADADAFEVGLRAGGEGVPSSAGTEGDKEEDYTGPHDLALLFMVFANGALVHVGSAPPEAEAEAEHLHQIARAALALQPVLEKPSLVTVQALHLLSIYTAMSGGSGADAETSMEMTWSLITLAAHLCQTIGLHRDSARWGLSAKMVQRRRILFWDVFVADVWQSLNTGRPPSFSLAYIDCSFPQYENKEKDGVFEIWQFRFAAECVAEVTARTLTAEAPSYATIMELDRKVREFPLPPLDDAPGEEDNVGASLQRCVLEHIRETVLMYIHRSFFAQAIIEQPTNPLKSTYAPSFLAAYRASATILKSVRDQFAVMPVACARFWTMWTFAFSAAVVFGTVVTRGPRSPLAAAAMAELEQACVLFAKAAAYSRRATKALPILRKLSEKARHALGAVHGDAAPAGGENSGLLWNVDTSMRGVLGPGGQPVKVKVEEPDDELSIFAGHTRFVSGQVQRAAQPGPGPVAASMSSAVVPRQHRPQRHSMHGRPEDMQFELYDAQAQYPPQHPHHHPQQQQAHQQPHHPQQQYQRQRLHSLPSSASQQHDHFLPQHAHARPTPTVNVNVNVNWAAREFDHSPPASAVEERYRQQHRHQQQHQHQHPLQNQFYTPDGSRMVPSQYSWPVEQYPVDAEGQQQQHPHSHYQQQQQQQYATPEMYPHPQHAAYQAHNAELAQLGLAARDSRLDERWSTFMEDSGLLEGIDFRGR